MTEEAFEDEQETELESLQAIYPELTVCRDKAGRYISLALEVAPVTKVKALFGPPPATPTLAVSVKHQPAGPSSYEVNGAEDPPRYETLDLEYLPSLQLEMALSPEYPEHCPPTVKLLDGGGWLPFAVESALQHECTALWQEYGRTQMLFAYIDHLYTAAEQGFGTVSTGLYLDHVMKRQLQDFNTRKAREKFELGNYDCGVCLEPKKGASCHRLSYCGHIFCLSCLQDFYNSAITEGDITNIRCLAPDCKDDKRKKPRTLHPRELLKININRPQVQRYVDLKLKKKLESDKTTIFCPRSFCQAPARSPKFAKYISPTTGAAEIDNYPSTSDSEDDSSPAADDPEPQAPRPHKPSSDTDRLRICSKCTYAFCRTCQRSWHGDLIHCRPPKSNDPGSMTAEEAASYDYIRTHTSACPTCGSPAQKTHGCNHMICYTCNTHFCYLCSAWLHSGNPYQHFNTGTSPCYMRLWELEEGDEGLPGADGAANGEAVVNAVFGGQRAAEQAEVFAVMLAREQEAEADRAQEAAPVLVQAQRAHQPAHRNQQHAAQPLRQQLPAQQRQHQQHPQYRQQPGARVGGGGVVREQRLPDPGLQHFLQLAANDEEDAWDSDEMEEDFVVWEAIQALNVRDHVAGEDARGGRGRGGNRGGGRRARGYGRGR